MASYFFKGVKVLTKEQHDELLKTGYYTMPDGTQIQRNDEYFYASPEIIDLEELATIVGANSQSIEDIYNTLQNYQTKQEIAAIVDSITPVIIVEG